MNYQARLFWICQLSGWGIVTLANLTLQLLKKNVNLQEQIAANLLLFTAGFLVTSLLRLTIKKYRIIEMRWFIVVLAILSLSLLTAISITAVTLGGMTLLPIDTTTPYFSRPMVVGNVLAVFPIVIIWSSIYLAIQYLKRWRQSEIDKLSLEAALKDAQLNTLMGQINPHFMFNALNNIRSLMLLDVDRARDSLTHLAQVLRYNLKAPSKKVIVLKDELSVVEDFIQLAKIHLEERLQWHCQVDVNSDRVLIPPMIIQMLIENAIKHGISEVKGGGELRLTITDQQERLHIVVENTGELSNTPGLSSGERTYQQESQDDTQPFNSTQLGLANIRQRLKILYQENADFSISQQGDKVVAKIVMPLEYSQ